MEVAELVSLFFFSSQCGGGWGKFKKKCPMIEKESNK